jgi:TM2 domain-containing membrane protein YozV
MAKVLDHLPELDGNELKYIRNLIEDMDDKTAREFADIYRKKRRSLNSIFMFTLLGFVGVAGIQRFRLGKFGTGLLYLLTLGFVFAGTLYDLLTYEKVVFEHNKFAAIRVDMDIRGDS